MLKQGRNDISAMRGRLIWPNKGNEDSNEEEILSCYFNGYWIDEYPWTDDTSWTD